jgi:hypothetical protein
MNFCKEGAQKFIDFCFIVFYMGDNPSRKSSNSSYDNRIHYLERTINNSLLYSKRAVVFVCNSHDRDVVLQSSAGKNAAAVVTCIQINCPNPKCLPVDACLYVQQNYGELNIGETDVLYFTEADHLLFVKDNIVETIMSLKDENLYFSMHRLEPIYENHGNGRGPNTEFAGHKFVLPSGDMDCIEPNKWNDVYYRSPNKYEGYAGAFIVGGWAFLNINYISNGILEMPSFCIFGSLPCLKTINIDDLFIIHLSGYDYHVSMSSSPASKILPPYYANN